LSLPREEKKDLYLIQQYLVLQIFLYPGLPWNLELVLSDLTKVPPLPRRPNDESYSRPTAPRQN
jgi:hypothetical protein